MLWFKNIFAHGRISRNVIFGLGQSIIITVSIFLVYRLAVTQVGLSKFGIWSLLLSGTALVRIGDISGAGALSRFIAIQGQSADAELNRDTIHTVVLTTLVLNLLIGGVVWLLAALALPMFIDQTNIEDAKALVPYVVGSFVFGAVAVAVTSAVDGLQRADQRAIVISGSALFFLAASWILVPRWGVIGFGAAQVLQQLVILGAGWLVLRSHIDELGWLPNHWRRTVFVETTSFALKLNAMSLVAILFEPLVKFSFNATGGPGLVALYDFASRSITQLRGLVISAATPLIPRFAAAITSNDPTFSEIFSKSTRYACISACSICVICLSAAPVVSYIVLGKISYQFLEMNSILTAGWSINTIAVPTYFAAQAHGNLRWNFLSQVAMAVTASLAVLIFVPVFGFRALELAIFVGLALSMVIELLGNMFVLGTFRSVYDLRALIIGTTVFIVAVCSADLLFIRIL